MTKNSSIALFPEIAQFLEARKAEFELIPPSRKEELSRMATYVVDSIRSSGKAQLTFICTHNSRRSHLSQIWAKVAADACGILNVETFSGGTEATAMNPRVVASLRRTGFEVASTDLETGNPRYNVRYAADHSALECFSKVHDEPPNPTSSYAAVMTCSSADQACPIVSGCELRLPIRYEDPKVADDTPQEHATYDERSRQICREMLFAMQQV